MTKPRQWTKLVNKPQREVEVNAIRKCIARGQSYGSDTWVAQTAAKLGLEFTLRPHGRPRES